MTTAEVLLLGGIAGVTIFLGLPIARLRRTDARLQSMLSSLATGVLIFLLWDMLSHAVEPIEPAHVDHEWTEFAQLAGTFFVGLALGFISLVYYERWASGRGVDHLVVPETEPTRRSMRLTLTPAANLALLIAVGIGLHNFSEGLAIGQSAAAGELRLAYALIVGFALHNSTEGFGIAGPLSGAAEPPSWRFLFLLGLIGGAPTFLGTVLGQVWVNDFVSIAFLSLAAGSILFVIRELLNLNHRSERKYTVAWGLLLGLALGFATDWVLVAAGE
jgi:ZIP family zinc transporter